MLTGEPLQFQSGKSFYSMYKEARAMFSSMLSRGENVVADRCDESAAESISFDWQPEVPQGQVFDPANCYIFERANLPL